MTNFYHLNNTPPGFAPSPDWEWLVTFYVGSSSYGSGIAIALNKVDGLLYHYSLLQDHGDQPFEFEHWGDRTERELYVEEFRPDEETLQGDALVYNKVRDLLGAW